MVKYKILSIVLQNMANSKDNWSRYKGSPNCSDKLARSGTGSTCEKDKLLTAKENLVVRAENKPVNIVNFRAISQDREEPAAAFVATCNFAVECTAGQRLQEADQLHRAYSGPPTREGLGTLCSRSRCSAMPHRVPAWTSPVSASSSRRKKLARYQEPRSLKKRVD